jgi:hypothetical protein
MIPMTELKENQMRPTSRILVLVLATILPMAIPSARAACPLVANVHLKQADGSICGSIRDSQGASLTPATGTGPGLACGTVYYGSGSETFSPLRQPEDFDHQLIVGTLQDPANLYDHCIDPTHIPVLSVSFGASPTPFGPPIPLPVPGSCVMNRLYGICLYAPQGCVQSDCRCVRDSDCLSGPCLRLTTGTLDAMAGGLDLDVETVAQIYLTACPQCVNSACNAGANSGQPCTTSNAAMVTNDCPPLEPPLISVPVSMILRTASAGATQQTQAFCGGGPGAFGAPTAVTISEQGAPAVNLADTQPHGATLASVFCIPATSSGFDSAIGLPGPGAAAWRADLSISGSCGDHIVNPGEACDQGAANGTAGSCCDATCHLKTGNPICHVGTGSACDPTETCNGTSPTCPTSDGLACNNGVACDGQDTCLYGQCMAGTPPPGACNDGNSCTQDTCVPGSGCQNVPANGTACGDGNACHDLSTCSAGTCPPGTAIAGCDPAKSVTGVVGPTGSATTLTSPDMPPTVTVTIPAGALPPATPVVAALATAGNFSIGSGTRVASLLKLESPVQPSLPVKIKLGWQEVSLTQANSQVVTTTTPYPRENQLQIFHNSAPIVSDPTTCKTTSATYPACAQCFANPTLALDQQTYTKASCATACGGLECCCDPTNNFWEFQTASFSEFAVGSSACGAADKVRLAVANIGLAGQGKLGLSGQFTLPAGVTLDPVTTGVEVILGDVPVPAVDVTIPGGAYNTSTGVGWLVSRRGDRWTYLDRTAAPPGGIYKVQLHALVSPPGLVRFAVWGRGGTYAATTAVSPGVVLPGGSAGCYAAVFPGPAPAPICRLRSTTLRCR